jgi:hypothetical protein
MLKLMIPKNYASTGLSRALTYLKTLHKGH